MLIVDVSSNQMLDLNQWSFIMASVSLSVKDLAKLSDAARNEIYELFPTARIKQTVDETYSHDDEFYPVSKRLAVKCLAKPIDPKSVQLLRSAAEHHGRVLWSVVRDSLGLARWQDLKGVLSGLNRRLRSLTNDSEAILIAWDASEDQLDAEDEYVDGFLKVHPETAKSLRAYFGLS
jgi:hypothetical protein